MEISSLPFNKSLGITTDGVSIFLSPRSEHLNHVGTVHAAVIFGIAEAATGQSLLNQFPDLANSFVALLRGSTVKYRRPASVNSAVCGTGTLSEADASQFIETLQSRGRATVDISVSVVQGDNEVFTGTFTWFAGRQ